MALIHIFGDKPVPKVLEFFTINQFWDYSLKDVSIETGVSYRTLQTITPLLVQEGILKYTRTEGKAELYKINKDSEAVKQLIKISRNFPLGNFYCSVIKITEHQGRVILSMLKEWQRRRDCLFRSMHD